jgi:hypothetical protein
MLSRINSNPATPLNSTVPEPGSGTVVVGTRTEIIGGQDPM